MERAAPRTRQGAGDSHPEANWPWRGHSSERGIAAGQWSKAWGRGGGQLPRQLPPQAGSISLLFWAWEAALVTSGICAASSLVLPPSRHTVAAGRRGPVLRCWAGAPRGEKPDAMVGGRTCSVHPTASLAPKRMLNRPTSQQGLLGQDKGNGFKLKEGDLD